MYQKYSIGTMAHLMGISAEALRYYESKNIVSPIRDPETGYRYFNTWDFHMLLRARHYQNYGFSLEEIGELFRSGELSQVREKMEDQEVVIEKGDHPSDESVKTDPSEPEHVKGCHGQRWKVPDRGKTWHIPHEYAEKVHIIQRKRAAGSDF